MDGKSLQSDGGQAGDFERLNPGDRVPFNRNWKHLKQMSNPRNKNQLLMFMTGAGGSEKSEVIPKF